MSYYADTSFFIALRVPHDTFHREALAFYEQAQEAAWFWSPWHRVEVFHALRQLTRHPESSRAISPAEAKALIHRIETDVRLGYYTHLEADWRDVLRTANEISIAHALEQPFATADLLHIAYALELAAEVFVSFDEAQLTLAEAVGLKTIRPK